MGRFMLDVLFEVGRKEGVGVPQFVEFWEFCLKAFTVRAVSQCGQ